VTQEEHPVTILHVTVLSINYNKTHKPRLKYEIKYNLHEIAQFKKPLKNKPEPKQQPILLIYLVT